MFEPVSPFRIIWSIRDVKGMIDVWIVKMDESLMKMSNAVNAFIDSISALTVQPQQSVQFHPYT